MRLKDKIAVVTGSTRGIGRAVARLYAQEGAKVLIHGSDPERAEGVVAEIRSTGGEAVSCACDMGASGSADNIVATALDAFGGLDILVNNAAISTSHKLVDFPEEAFDREIAVNLKGTFLLTQAVVSQVMAKQQTGKIINVTSHGAFRGAKTKTGYAASKMGVLGMTLVWANELMGQGINVNCVAPAANTDMLKGTSPERLQALLQSFERSSVLRRMPDAEDVAPIFLFLASPDSDFLTGQLLQANGQPMHFT